MPGLTKCCQCRYFINYLHLTEEKLLRLKEIKKLTQDHTAITKQSWDVNSTTAASRVELLNFSTTILDWIILCMGGQELSWAL